MTLAVVVVFGALTGMDAARIAAGEPTPWLGVVERINIGAFLLWVVVLAVALWRTRVGTDDQEPSLKARHQPDRLAGRRR